MNIFRKYTRKSLAANKARTLVTIIGIILSMALLTAVIEGAYSGVRFMEGVEEARSGRWEIYFSDMSDEKLARLKADPEVKEIVSWNNLGFAEIDNKRKETDPYLIVNSLPEDLGSMVPLNLLEGRLPENETEIIIPHNMYSDITVGKVINVSVGQRVSSSGDPLGFSGYTGDEKIVNAAEKTYTVVGVYIRLDRNIIPYTYPGFIAITKSSEGSVTGSFVTLKNPAKSYDFYDDRCSRPDSSSYISSGGIHGDLLAYKGAVKNSRVQQMIYGFAAILVIMVAFGSVSLIYNSFSISLAERTRQFGILKSIGATKKQLKSSVIYEALVLGGIGIPAGLIVGCGGIGLTLYLLKGAFKAFAAGYDVEMKLVLNPIALVIAVVVCLAVILISAWIPAGRAVRIQPIDAIRQNADTRVKAREVKTSKLTQKLFGFEGTMASKNFKRNAKRYRTTIISLFMSVVLFISASSFCAYLTGSVEGIVSDGQDADIIINDYNKDRDPEQMLEMLSGISGIDRIVYNARTESEATTFDPAVIAESFWNLAGQEEKSTAFEDGEYSFPAGVAFADDAEFRRILKESGISEDGFFDPQSPKGVLFNKINGPVYIDGEDKWFSFAPVDSSKLPITVKMKNYKELDDYVRYDETEEGGKRFVMYYPVEYMQNLSGSPDASKALKMPYEESVFITELVVTSEVKQLPMNLSTNYITVLYPYSMTEHVLKDDMLRKSAISSLSYGIKSADSASVYSEISRLQQENRIDKLYVQHLAESRNTQRMIVTVINVFAYGFIILISLIALANVFNTISTSIMLRRREFAMLRSIGLSKKGFSKMMNYECIIYGARSLLFGLPVAVLMTFLIWKVTSNAFETSFYIPWRGVVIAVASVFIVVFATMLYATSKIRKDNTIEALRNENL